MDGNNWRPAQDGGNPGMDSPDWRNQLSQSDRQQDIRHFEKALTYFWEALTYFWADGLVEFQKIVVRFEEKIYTLATSQTDYLRRISVKMLTMEAKSQTSVANSSGVGGQNPSDAENWVSTPKKIFAATIGKGDNLSIQVV